MDDFPGLYGTPSPTAFCNKCKEVKPLSEFTSVKDRCTQTKRCDPCRTRERVWAQKHRREQAERLRQLSAASGCGPWRVPASSASCPPSIDATALAPSRRGVAPRRPAPPTRPRPGPVRSPVRASVRVPARPARRRLSRPRVPEGDCGVKASYGLPGHAAARCAPHKRRGDVRHPRMRCSECRELGTRDLEGVRFCECHAPPGSRNVALHPCVVCGLDDILDASGRCPTCDPDRAAKIAKRHEMQVKAFLDSEIAAGSLPAYETHDRMIDGGACVRVRPDFVWDAATHMVVLEVDENQHMQYACECEQARMANVGQAMGMPTLFIRYNPDGFRADDGGRARKRSASLLKRMETLKSYLRWCARPEASPGNHGAFVRAVYLYYDGWTDAAPEWRTVVPLDAR
eukprot:jgi/Mesvir1/9101/Mv03843-RA.1